uniref:Pre-mRNA splicing Prp18-interacting factor n=1 Tax=Tanacetum cinerariifolium TaxID=118510 RepID=A0A6L2JMM9_TANCI|nr:hypothetical protein [Tanacetum cinerariifolium]
MNLFNGTCDNCIYRNGKPVTCNACEGMLRGGFCLPCDLKEKNSYNCDPNAYSFNNSNYLSQPQYENYLCNLCGNNSHDGYDCQQQFPFVFEQEPSYNQNYNDNYYPHDSPSFLCYDNCGGSHETFQCQPIDQNVDFSSCDQIQTPQYPEVHPPSQEIKYVNSPSRDCSNFFNDNEEHYVQNKESLENSSNEIDASNSNQEKEEPPQDSDISQLIREECCIEVCEEQKQKMEDTILELVEICRQKELYCMHDNEVKNVVEQPAERGTRIEKSLQNFRVIHKSSISLNNTSQISLVHAITPILLTKEPEYSLSMGYEHPNATPETKSDEIIKTGVEELIPNPNECEVTSKDKKECDVLVCEDSSAFDVCDNHSEILSDYDNDDDISSDENAFADIDYVDASLPDPEIVSVEEENVVYQEEEEIDLEDIFQIQDVVLCKKLLSINRLIESLNDNPTPDCVLNSFALIPIFEEFDNSLSDNFSPEFEIFAIIRKRREVLRIFAYDPEGDIRFLEELLIDDSIPFPVNESFENDPSFPRPPPEPPDDKFDFEPDSGEVISAVMKNIDELNKDECFDPGGEINVSTNDEDVDYFPIIFVIRSFLPYLIYHEVFPLFLSAKSEDTIFDPGKDYAKNVKNQLKTGQYRIQDWKSIAKAGSTGHFLKESSN